MGHFTNYKIDHRSKKSMLNFIYSHRTHNDSAWTGQTVANNVRITSLNLPRELVDAAFEYIDQDNWFSWSSEFSWYQDEFSRDHNDGDFAVYVAGRSGGWIELQGRGYRSVFDKYDQRMTEDNFIEDIRYLCNVIEDFDQFCDMVRDEFIACVKDFAERMTEEAKIDADEEAARLEPAFPL